MKFEGMHHSLPAYDYVLAVSSVRDHFSAVRRLFALQPTIMSFWASMNYAVSSVDQILDKERFTLDELLGASEIIQETQSLNGRLIAFLNKPETVSQLLEYIVVPAPLGQSSPQLCACSFQHEKPS